MPAPEPNRTDASEEALLGPSKEQWEAMSAAQREAFVEALFRAEQREAELNLEAMAEGEEHYDAKEEIRSTLRSHFGRLGRAVYIGAERMVLYPRKKRFTPDVLVVMDVSPHKRDCWMVSEEGRGLDVVIEVFNKGEWQKDFVDNVKKYAALGIPEYFIYDVGRGHLTAYRLPEGAGAYEPIRNRAGKYRSEKLGLELAVRQRRLRFYVGNAMLPTPEEVIKELEQITEQEQARAQAEEARAQAEEARAEAEEARAVESLAQQREMLLALLASKGLVLTEQQEYEVRCCMDPLLLRRWFDRALRAQGAQEVFEDA